MIRGISMVLVVLTSAYAVLLGVHALVNEPESTLTHVKAACVGLVIVSVMLVVRWQWARRPLMELERLSVFVGGLTLIGVGAANVVWTVHLGLVSGDWEYYGFVGGAMISLLGAIVAICLAFPKLFHIRDARFTPAVR